MDCNLGINGSSVLTMFGACQPYDDVGYYQWFRKIPNFLYGVGQATVTYYPETTATGAFTETWTTLTNNCKKDGVTTACPAGFVLTPPGTTATSYRGQGTFTFYTNSNSDRGVWTITM